MLRNEEYLRGVEAFAEAGVDGGAWSSALDVLASATRSAYGELIGLGSAHVQFAVSQLPDAAYRDFAEADGHSPSVNPRVLAAAGAAPLEIVGDREYDAVTPQLRGGEAFADLVRKYDIPNACLTTLIREPDMLVGVAVLRTERDGRIDADGIAAFAALVPHALAAVRTRRALGDQSAWDMAKALEHAGVTAFICGADGAVHALTGRAERLVVDGRLITMARRRLVAARAPDEAILQRAMGLVLRGEAPSGGAETLVLGSHGARAVIHLQSLGLADWGLSFQPRLLVIVRQAPRRPSVEVLRLAYGLTMAEAEIALALASGRPREFIAQQRGVALGTLRQQVKAILAKAGVSREAELIVAVQALG